MIFTSILVSCAGTDVPTPVKKTGICFVLCDFSASQSPGSRQKIMTNALRLFDKSIKNYQWQYYDIGSNRYDGSFFTYNDSTNITATLSEHKAIAARKKLRRDSLNREMIKLSVEQGNRNTCIMRTLDKIAGALPRNPRVPKPEVKIYILSDMLEDCNDGQRINIDNASFDVALKNLSKLPKPDFTFKDYQEIEIIPVVSSDKNTNFRNLFEFWKQVLAKYDYTLTAMPIDLPD